MNRLSEDGKLSLYHINWGDGDNTFVIAQDKEDALNKMTDGRDMVNSVIDLRGTYKAIARAAEDNILRRDGRSNTKIQN